MLRGYYTAASGMLAQQRRQEALSNNMSNAYTPGYKADQGVMRAFPELLIERIEAKKIPVSEGLRVPLQTTVGSLNTGVYMQEAVPDFAQGDIQETGVATDMALVNGTMPDENGTLFFTTENEAGEVRFTRDGNFTVDGEGFLVTGNGNYILNQDGQPIQTNGIEFNVTDDGLVQLDEADIPLGIAYAANANDMVKEGNGLFRLADEGQALVNARNADGVEFSIRQKFLERSNVDPTTTMTEMMNTYRSFEMNQRVLKAYDQSMDKAVNEIGRLT
ncbi:flagellar hook-basal body protein [Thalassobacillus hwangdonensis]|uniref:Flagellar hook-basal body protein n=1 Tax=Thalassobacillus hwangdonensis TaxID=546108 RepID=A0ABW3L2W5_9BACI